MSELIPHSINNRGVITATDRDGTRHHFHTDEQESRQFAFASMCLSAGCVELFFLLFSNDSPHHAQMRQKDGRTNEQLKDDWLSKVCRAGLSKSQALAFLNARLSLK